jgi:hypothetical protein
LPNLSACCLTCVANWDFFFSCRIPGGLSEGEQVVHSFVVSHKSKLQAIAEQVR